MRPSRRENHGWTDWSAEPTRAWIMVPLRLDACESTQFSPTDAYYGNRGNKGRSLTNAWRSIRFDFICLPAHTMHPRGACV